MATFAKLIDAATLKEIVVNKKEEVLPSEPTIDNTPILEFQEEYRWLSNFAECTINFNGYTFKSVEHAYQAAKCARHEDIKKFVDITAGQAKRLGRKIIIRSDWQEVKIPIMRELLVQKFLLNEYFAELLLATENRKIQEGNAWNDTFWGVCSKTNNGKNHLGKLIMDLRYELTQMY